MLFFYQPDILNDHLYLDGEEYHHCVKVLRKKPGDIIGVLNGKGEKFEAQITNVTGKECQFTILARHSFPKKSFYNHIAIAPTKNADRIEWFVEKACELGVDRISFIQTRNSERAKLRLDRLEKKAVSALKQSKNGHLTTFDPLMSFGKFIETAFGDSQKFIAYVAGDLPYLFNALERDQSSVVLIGPEGDFDPAELALATSKGFTTVSLGENTLRTETAGIIAAHLLNVINAY